MRGRATAKDRAPMRGPPCGTAKCMPPRGPPPTCGPPPTWGAPPPRGAPPMRGPPPRSPGFASATFDSEIARRSVAAMRKTGVIIGTPSDLPRPDLQRVRHSRVPAFAEHGGAFGGLAISPSVTSTANGASTQFYSAAIIVWRCTPLLQQRLQEFPGERCRYPTRCYACWDSDGEAT
jgi:hypothetical protein